MAAQKGRDMLLKVGDGATPTEAFTTVAGIRTKSFSINNESVDVTTGDSGTWRELLEGAGIKSASLSGDGVFTDNTTGETVRAAMFNGTIKNWTVLIPGFGTIKGKFQLSQCEYSGVHNGEVTYKISLDSAGALTWTALP